jgi:hypothetical protein
MNNLISTGIFLAGLGYCIQSVATAFALPNTAAISMGSNPVDSFYGFNNNTTMTLNPTYDFILTSGYSAGTNCILNIDGTNVNRTGSAYNIFYYNTNSNINNAFLQGTGTLKIPAGATVTLTSCEQYLFSGYYVQP